MGSAACIYICHTDVGLLIQCRHFVCLFSCGVSIKATLVLSKVPSGYISVAFAAG